MRILFGLYGFVLAMVGPSILSAQTPFLHAARSAYAADRFKDALFLSEHILSFAPDHEEALSLHVRAALQVLNNPDTLFARWAPKIKSTTNPDLWHPYVLHHLRAHRIDTAMALLKEWATWDKDELHILSLRCYLSYYQKDDNELIRTMMAFFRKDILGKHLDFMAWILASRMKEQDKSNLLDMPILKEKDGLAMFLTSILLDDPKKSPIMASEAGLATLRKDTLPLPFVALYGATQAWRHGQQKSWTKIIGSIEIPGIAPHLDLMSRFLNLALSDQPQEVTGVEGYALGMDFFDLHGLESYPDRMFLYQWFDSCEIAFVHSNAQMVTSETVWPASEPVVALYLLPGLCGQRTKDQTRLMQLACTRLLMTLSGYEPHKDSTEFLPWAQALLLKKHRTFLTHVPKYLNASWQSILASDLEAMSIKMNWTEASYFLADHIREGRIYYALSILEVVAPVVSKYLPGLEWPNQLHQQLLGWKSLSSTPTYCFAWSEHHYLRNAAKSWEMEHMAYALEQWAEQYRK